MSRRLKSHLQLEQTYRLLSCPRCKKKKDVYISFCAHWVILPTYIIRCDACGVSTYEFNSINKAVRRWNTKVAWKGKTWWQDIGRTWLTVDQVYETRWDCMAAPEGVRQAAQLIDVII